MRVFEKKNGEECVDEGFFIVGDICFSNEAFDSVPVIPYFNFYGQVILWVECRRFFFNGEGLYGGLKLDILF